jgi:DNA polymerase-3 subunit delta
MPASFDSIYNDLGNNSYAPFYFFQGDEPYFIDVLSDYIEQHALPEEQKGFNQMVLYGKDVKVNEVLSQARRFPMMSDRQVVLVKEAQEISDLRNKSGQQLLENYLENPVPSTILVFCHKYKNLDGRSALAKRIDQKAILFTSKKLYDNQVPHWVTQYFQNKGFDPDPKVPFMVAGFIGNDLERIAHEIDKMLINFTDPIKITPEHVEKFIGLSKEFNAFELQNAIAHNEHYKAFQITQYFAANPRNAPIIPVVAVLFSFFSKLLILHSSEDKSDKALSSKMKVNVYFLNDYKTAAGFYGLQKTLANIKRLKEADLRLKGIGSNMKDNEILKELVYHLLVH